MNAKLVQALGSAPVSWDTLYHRLDKQAFDGGRDVLDFVSDLEATAERAARLGSYLRARAMSRGHKAAVDAQNDTATGVRRALGYSYPDRGNFTF